MQQAVIVGVSVSLPFVLTGCGGGGFSGKCEPIMKTVQDTVNHTGNVTSAVTINFHGDGSSSCCQYFVDVVAGHLPSAAPSGCDVTSAMAPGSHITSTMQFHEGDCSQNQCVVSTRAFSGGTDTMTMAADIPLGAQCCSEWQNWYNKGSALGESCAPNNGYCLIRDLSRSSSEVTPNHSHVALIV